MTEPMTKDFGWALRHLRAGHKVARQGWNGKGMFLYYVPKGTYPSRTEAAKSIGESVDYQAYIAIIPGDCLATMYERFGARLLEQNVRSFLQFAGKINKGIRDTIRTEPHMFLAFNNGLALTADDIVLSEDGRSIKSISNT